MDDGDARRLADLLDGWLDAAPAHADPAEDAIALRAALLRVRPGARQAIALRLWREAEGWRERRAVTVWPPDAPTFDFARRRFGEGAALKAAETPEAAVAAIGGEAVAVLALGAGRPWWGRLLARPRLKVFAALPELGAAGRRWTLAVREGEIAMSGQDETFWVSDAGGSAAAVEDALARLGFAASLIDEAAGLRLFSFAGYVQAGDERLSAAPGEISGVIGWSPAAFDL